MVRVDLEEEECCGRTSSHLVDVAEQQRTQCIQSVLAALYSSGGINLILYKACVTLKVIKAYLFFRQP